MSALWKRVSPQQQAAGQLALVALGLLAAVRVAHLPLAVRAHRQWEELRALSATMEAARQLEASFSAEPFESAVVSSEAPPVQVRSGSLAHILDLLGRQAEAHRLELRVVQPRADEEEPERLQMGAAMTLRRTPLVLQLAGRYRAVGAFLGELSRAPFLASVRQVTCLPQASGRPGVKTEAVLSVYLPEERR